ncbi:MAG: trimethylamine methyltransferase family protein [Desulfobacterales bacterium]|nr:trimethylamine methyltransferase family protein [Desulfobacterales bacterium]
MSKQISFVKKIKKLDQMALRILEEIGIRILSKPYLKILAEKGGCIKGNRIFFKEGQINELLTQVPAQFTLKAANPVHDIEIGEGASKIAAGYGCASIIDADGKVRDSLYQDHLELVKLVHESPLFGINGGILAHPNDVQADKSHLAMHYAALVYSDKSVMGMPGTTKQMEEIMALTAIRMGGERTLKESARIITMVSPVSPLQFDEMLLNSVEVAARYHQPVMASPGVAAGTTGPIDLAGNIAMATAEALGVILTAQLFHPGTPVIFGLQCYGVDMTTGNISIGSPAYALQAKYCAAMGKYYGLPTRAGGAANDAKSLSPQSGYESMLSMFTAMQNNVSLIVHGAGILDSFSGISFEKFIMDLEIIEMIQYYLEDLDVSDDALSFDLIKEIGPGGLFLTSADTMKKCRSLAWSPSVAIRGSLNGLTPEEKLMKNIDDTREKMLNAYQQPEMSIPVLKEMERFMTAKGMDPSTLCHA